MKIFILTFAFVLAFVEVSAQNYKKGFKELEENNFDVAAAHFNKIIAENENDAVANYALGVIYSDSRYGDFDLLTAFEFLKLSDNAKVFIPQKTMARYDGYFTLDKLASVYTKVDTELYNKIVQNLQDSVLMSGYLSKCKESAFYDQVVVSYDDYNFAKVENALSVDGLKSFILKYPESGHLADANQLLSELELLGKIQEKGNLDDIHKYYDDFPQGRFAQVVDSINVEVSWVEATKAPTIELLQKYLDEFGSSKYTDEATAKIKELEKQMITNDITQYLRNNQVLNKFSFNPEGELMLLYQNVVYKKCNLEGDCWTKEYGDFKTNALAFSLARNHAIYRVEDEKSVGKSLDGGNNWIAINNGLPDKIAIKSIFVNPENDEVFITTDRGLYRTKDGGFYWDMFYEGRVKQMITFPEYKNLIFLLVDNTILYLAKDGVSWINIQIVDNLRKSNPGTGLLDIKNIFYLPSSKGTKLLAATNHGLFSSPFGDFDSWEKISDNFFNDKIISSMSANDEEIIIATSSLKVGVAMKNEIYKSRLNPLSFQKIDVDLSAFSKITGITKSYDSKGYFIASESRIGYLSDEGLIGLNYGLLPHSDIDAFTATVGDGKIYFAMVNNNQDIDTERFGVWKSANLVTWEMVYTADIPHENETANIYLSPHDTDEIWIVYDDNRGHDKYTLSYNGGSTWQELRDFPDNAYEIKNPQFHPFRKDVVYFQSKISNSKLIRYDKSTSSANELRKTYGFLISQNDDQKIFNINVDNERGLILEVSYDGGWTFEPSDSDIKDFLPGVSFDDILNKSSVIISPQIFKDDCIVLMVIDGQYDNAGINYLLKSMDNGNTWETLKTLGNAALKFVYVEPKNINDILVGAEFDHTFVLSDGTTNPPGYYISYPTISGTWRELLLPEKMSNPSGGFRTHKGQEATLYLYGEKGLFCSQDEINWEKIGGIKNQNKKKILK